MSPATIGGSARTPLGSIGGAARSASIRSQAGAVARLAIERATIAAAGIDAVVAAVGLPVEGTDLGLAAAVAADLELGRSTATSTLIGVDAAADALALATRHAATGTTVLLIGAESASRAAYWVGGVRLGASEAGSTALDPLGAVLDPLNRGGSPPHLLEEEAGRRGLDRAALDAYAAGSHAAAAGRQGSGAAALAASNGLGDDELVVADATAERLRASPSLHTRGGDLTVANCAAPVDGAVALLISPEGDGPTVREPRRAAVEPGTSSAAASSAAALLDEDGTGVDSLERIALGECSAAQALVAIEDLGADRSRVNPLGGSIALGRPSAGAALLLAAEAADGLAGGDVLVCDEGPTGTGLATLISVGSAAG